MRRRGRLRRPAGQRGRARGRAWPRGGRHRAEDTRQRDRGHRGQRRERGGAAVAGAPLHLPTSLPLAALRRGAPQAGADAHEAQVPAQEEQRGHH